MKKLVPIFLIFLSTLPAFTQTIFNVKIEGPKSITCGDSMTLTAHVMEAVTIRCISSGVLDDVIGLQVADRNSQAVVIDTLRISVPASDTVITTIFLPAGNYTMYWKFGGATVANPDVSGSIGPWRHVDGNELLDFNADTTIASGDVQFEWLPIGVKGSTFKTAPNRSSMFVVLAMYTDSTTVMDTLFTMVKPLTAQVEDAAFTCGNASQLNVATNYSGTGELAYHWSPATGLSDPDIRNPLSQLTGNMDYSVQVETANGCQASDEIHITASKIAESPAICMVTVNENNKNDILWKNLPDAVDSILIFRELSGHTEEYELIGEVSAEPSGMFRDTSSDASVKSNKYRVAWMDVCGFMTDMGIFHKTMHLAIERGLANTWNLSWETYVGLELYECRIYRGPSKDNLQLTATIPAYTTTYTDETAPAGEIYYQVEVLLPVDCALLKSAVYSSSFSNIAHGLALPSGLDMATGQDQLFYPNPAVHELFVRKALSSGARILIYDLGGNLVMEYSGNTMPLDISGLSKGVYAVKVIDAGSVITCKVVKE